MAIMFAYLICFVVMSNPTAMASVQSETYAAIFAANDTDQFQTALNNYFDEHLSVTSNSPNLLIHENGQVLNNQALENSYSIQENYYGLVNATALDFLIILGSASSSTYKVKVYSNSIPFPSQDITATSSGNWNKFIFPYPVSGIVEVNITGVSTHAGDTIPTFATNNIASLNGASADSYSSYYHTYQYQTTEYVNTRIYDPDTRQYYWVEVPHTVTATGWKTDSINEVPAIRIEGKDYTHYKYQAEGVVNGHTPINKYIYKNGQLTSTVLEGYADFPSLIGYKVTIQGVDPNFITDGEPLDQLLMEFLQNEGIVITSLDVNAFLVNLYSLLQNTTSASSTLWSTVINESDSLFQAINGPIDASHLTHYEMSHSASLNDLLLSQYNYGDYQFCTNYTWVSEDGTSPPVWTCIQSETRFGLVSVDELGYLSLASVYGLQLPTDDILILKTSDMNFYPSEPYFFNWLTELTQSTLGITFNQTILDSLNANRIYERATNTNLSLVLDPNAPTGTKPYVADVSVKDANGNMAMGTIPVTIKDPTGSVLGTGTVVNGSARVQLSSYSDSATAFTGGNDFYFSSQEQNTAKYDLQGMMQNLGPTGSDAIANAKFDIIRNYTMSSGAFDYNPATGNYTMNNNDAAYVWTDTAYNVMRGYGLGTAPQISQKELDSHQFDNQEFIVQKLWGTGDIISQTQQYTIYHLTKMQFFDLWLGQKLQPTAYGANPLEPSDYTMLNTTADDTRAMLQNDQSYFQNSGQTGKDFTAQVTGELATIEKVGFPTVEGALDQLWNWINNTIIQPFLNLVETFWATLTTCGELLNCVQAIWNNILAPGLGAFTEMVKNVVTFEANFVVDTVWNFLVQPNLPKENDFSLSPNLQNLLNRLINPLTLSNFSTSAHSVLDPLTAGLANMSIDFNTISSSFKGISDIAKDYGIFSIVFNLGGVQEVEWSIEAITTRIFNHLTTWFDQSTFNPEALPNFVNNNTDSSHEDQVLAIADQGSTIQSGMNSLAYDLLGLTPNQTPSDYPLNPGNTFLPATLGTSLSTSFIDYLGEELSSIASGLSGSLQNLALLGQVGIAVLGATITYWTFASIDLISYLIYNELQNSLSLANLPNILISNIESSQQILFNPQTLYDRALSDIVWIQASKMSNDVFTFIKMMNFANDLGWSLALQFAQTCIFSLSAFYFSWELNIDKSQLKGQNVPNILSSSTDILLNYLASIVSLITNLILYTGSVFVYLGYTTNTFILSLIKIFSIALSFGVQLKSYADNHMLSLLKPNLYISLITDRSSDTTILLTQIVGNTLTIVITAYKMAGKLPDPKVTLIATFASWQSYIIQFNLMTGTL